MFSTATYLTLLDFFLGLVNDLLLVNHFFVAIMSSTVFDNTWRASARFVGSSSRHGETICQKYIDELPQVILNTFWFGFKLKFWFEWSSQFYYALVVCCGCVCGRKTTNSRNWRYFYFSLPLHVLSVAPITPLALAKTNCKKFTAWVSFLWALLLKAVCCYALKQNLTRAVFPVAFKSILTGADVGAFGVLTWSIVVTLIFSRTFVNVWSKYKWQKNGLLMVRFQQDGSGVICSTRVSNITSPSLKMAWLREALLHALKVNCDGLLILRFKAYQLIFQRLLIWKQRQTNAN